MYAERGPDSVREEQLTYLVQTYQTPLLHLCYMILHDESLAEDAVQETFLKAYKALENFRRDSSEKTWLMRIGINVCRDMKRTRWFRYVDRRVTPETLVIPAAQADEESEELAQAVLRLPARDREVILLYYYQHMNLREISQTLGLVPSSVSNRLKKAREKLRLDLERGERNG